MKKILVTGATGFIGNHVINELLSQNYHVIATSSNIDKALKMSWFPRVEYHALDLNCLDETNNYYKFFNEPDILIHLAWQGLPDYKNDFHLIENYPKHLTFLSNLLEHGLADITVSGTCLEYGMQEGKLSENLKAYPSNAYAIAKNNLRISLQEICSKKQASLKWLRLFYMYGDGQSIQSLIPQLDMAIKTGSPTFNMSGGEQQRDFLPIAKVAKYITAVAQQKSIDGIINICSAQPQMVKDFVQDYLEAQNKNISLNLGFYPYADYEPMYFWGDDKKLRSIMK